ncbi:hypothetical protein ABW19_dt0203486 [Dactylella cylindrospora]|nr:hypothetical protein ABW19_dt0203486 [Dactylella cylindrospora]
MQADTGGYGTLVAYIDTAGTFSPITLLKVLMHRLQHGATQEAPHNEEEGSKDLKSKAAELLDRVQYMRTFDFDGLVDAITEVSAGIQKDEEGVQAVQEVDVKMEEVTQVADLGEENGTTGNEIVPEEMEDDDEIMQSAESQMSEYEEAVSEADEAEPETIIPDSQADSDEDILWPLPIQPKHDHGIRKKKSRLEDLQQLHISVKDEIPPPEIVDRGREPEETRAEPSPIDQVDPEPHNQIEEGRTVGLLIIDNISRPTEELLEAGEISGQAALTTFSRNLRSLAQDQAMAILVSVYKKKAIR